MKYLRLDYYMKKDVNIAQVTEAKGHGAHTCLALLKGSWLVIPDGRTRCGRQQSHGEARIWSTGWGQTQDLRRSSSGVPWEYLNPYREQLLVTSGASSFLNASTPPLSTAILETSLVIQSPWGTNCTHTIAERKWHPLILWMHFIVPYCAGNISSVALGQVQLLGKTTSLWYSSTEKTWGGVRCRASQCGPNPPWVGAGPQPPSVCGTPLQLRLCS